MSYTKKVKNMKTEQVLLSQVKVNEANPRTIKEHKLRLLMERLIVFPKMITLRPVVVDNTMTVLGGNMRVKALDNISMLSLDEIGVIAAKTKNFQRLTKAEQTKLLEHWQNWLDRPTVDIARASELSDAEKQEFIIADNASFGEWDYEALANNWDAEDLNSWGVDVWNPEKDGGSFGGFGGSSHTGTISSPVGIDHTEGSDSEEFDPNALPPELQGQDITPDDLPKIEGDNQTARERIIIVYPSERTQDLQNLLGLTSIDKVVYSIDELLPYAE